MGEVLNIICVLVEEKWMMVIVIYEMSFVCDVVDWVIFMDYGRIVE